MQKKALVVIDIQNDITKNYKALFSVSFWHYHIFKSNFTDSGSL